MLSIVGLGVSKVFCKSNDCLKCTLDWALPIIDIFGGATACIMAGNVNEGYGIHHPNNGWVAFGSINMFVGLLVIVVRRSIDAARTDTSSAFYHLMDDNT